MIKKLNIIKEYIERPKRACIRVKRRISGHCAVSDRISET